MTLWPRIFDYYDPLLQKSPSPKSHRKVTDRALRSRAGVCDFSVTFWRRISDYYDSLPRQIRRQKSTKCFKNRVSARRSLGLAFCMGCAFCLRWFGTLFQVLLLSTLPGTCRSGVVDPFILCYCSLLFRAAGPERQPQERRIRPKSLRCLMCFSFFQDMKDPANPLRLDVFDLI